MSKRWQKVWLVVGALFILVVGGEILKVSKTDTVIGEVHHQRQRQTEAGVKFFEGFPGRLTANKYLVASRKVILRKILK